MDENCHVEPITRTPSAAERDGAVSAELAVSGMGCQNCAARVRNSLVRVHGVIDAVVDHTLGTALVAFNPRYASTDQLIQAVAMAGGDGRHEYRAVITGQMPLDRACTTAVPGRILPLRRAPASSDR